MGYLAATTGLRADFTLITLQIYLKMNNLLKVSAAALFLTVGLTSCEKKTETNETTTTTPATESTTSTMSTDSSATSTAPAAPADGAMATDTTKKM